MEERLFSLVLALLATDSGLTKADILSTVQGYRHRYSRSGDNGNLERQFERDKDDIRDLGVPLETVESPGQSGDNHALRYRIPRGSYELPSDVRFTAEETTLLSLAAMVWREGSLSNQSRRAILKLRSRGVSPTEPVLGYAPQLRVRELSFEPLTEAVDKNHVVRFEYLKPGEQESRVRIVDPLALVQHQGHWYLWAREHSSDSTKTFLLSRIVSRVTVIPGTFDPPAADEAERALADLDEMWSSHLATLEVEGGSDASTRLTKRRGAMTDARGMLTLHYSDVNVLADELAGFGPEVLVISPVELRNAVRTRLERTADRHA